MRNKHPRYNYFGVHVETQEKIGPLTIPELRKMGHNSKKIKNHIRMDKSIYHKMKWRRELIK